MVCEPGMMSKLLFLAVGGRDYERAPETLNTYGGGRVKRSNRLTWWRFENKRVLRFGFPVAGRDISVRLPR